MTLLHSIGRKFQALALALPLTLTLGSMGWFAPAAAHASTASSAVDQIRSAVDFIARQKQEVKSAKITTGGFAQCPHFFHAGHIPKPGAASPGAHRQLCFDAFAVLHSGQSKTPLYVIERITPAQLADARDEERTNRFFADARLPSSERATLDDYRGSGYDRGHMAPAADMPNAQAMEQSFSLANMVPQDPVNNRKIWSKLESDTRKYIRRSVGPVYVISGPVFANGAQHAIGPGRVWVPTHLFKLVYDPSTQRAWAHWLENSANARVGAPISYTELSRRLGYELLAPGLIR